MSAAPRNRNHAFAGVLFRALAHSGVAHVCIAPGSRSTPLVAGAVATGALRLWTHVDERCAGFFALGLARQTGRLAAVVCTSGTAVANLLPAVCEAHHARIPLLLLTADRPPELRGWGAPQTLDQVGIFGARVRWSADAPPPDEGAVPLRHARALAARAVAAALGPPAGPVHLNLPFREPLAPTPEPDPERAAALVREWAAEEQAPVARVRVARAGPDAETVAALAGSLRSAGRGVLVAGPAPPDPAREAALRRLARAAGWPLVADALSGARSGADAKDAPLVTTADGWLRLAAGRPPSAPERTVQFGDPPTSRALREWLAAAPETEHVRIDPDGVWLDPEQTASRVVRADPTVLANAVAEALEAAPAPHTPWLDAWLAAEAGARRVLDDAVAREPALLEPALVAELAATLPDGATLFVSNSMPVRDVDGFLPVRDARLRVLGQRGVNGIDGVLSAALGAAAGGAEPLVLLIGDVALLHDLGGLLAATRNGVRATIVVVNNDGGGIFSLLPVAEHREAVAFETHVASAHGRRFDAAAELFGLAHARAHTRAELRRALDASFVAPTATLIEVPVSCEASVAHHSDLWARMAEAARSAWAGAP